MRVLTGDREYFKGVGVIPFEGPESDNPLAFRFYEPDRRETSPLRKMRIERYAGFDEGRGADFEAGRLRLEDLHAIAAAAGEPEQISGRQEWVEAILNRYL